MIPRHDRPLILLLAVNLTAFITGIGFMDGTTLGTFVMLAAMLANILATLPLMSHLYDVRRAALTREDAIKEARAKLRVEPWDGE